MASNAATHTHKPFPPHPPGGIIVNLNIQQHFIYNEQVFAILHSSLEASALLTDVIYHK